MVKSSNNNTLRLYHLRHQAPLWKFSKTNNQIVLWPQTSSVPPTSILSQALIPSNSHSPLVSSQQPSTSHKPSPNPALTTQKNKLSITVETGNACAGSAGYVSWSTRGTTSFLRSQLPARSNLVWSRRVTCASSRLTTWKSWRHWLSQSSKGWMTGGRRSLWILPHSLMCSEEL